MKQTITITLDLPHKYEPVAEFRPPKKGEEILYGHGTAEVDADVLTPCIVLTRKWKWPEWLGGRRIYPGCSNGKWYLYPGVGLPSHELNTTSFPLFVPPPDGKPRTNPKYRQEN